MKLIVVHVSPEVAPILHDDKIDIIQFCQEALDIIDWLIVSSKDKCVRADCVKDSYKIQNWQFLLKNMKPNEIQYT